MVLKNKQLKSRNPLTVCVEAMDAGLPVLVLVTAGERGGLWSVGRLQGVEPLLIWSTAGYIFELISPQFSPCSSVTQRVFTFLPVLE